MFANCRAPLNICCFFVKSLSSGSFLFIQCFYCHLVILHRLSFLQLLRPAPRTVRARCGPCTAHECVGVFRVFYAFLWLMFLHNLVHTLPLFALFVWAFVTTSGFTTALQLRHHAWLLRNGVYGHVLNGLYV